MKKKKRWIETGILLVIFVLAIMFFSFLTNRGDDNTTTGLDGATYPQIAFETKGYTVNALQGYAKEMDSSTLRDTITPVINGQVNMNIEAKDNQIAEINYYVYSIDGKEELYKDTVLVSEETVSLTFPGDELLKEEKLMKLVCRMSDGREIFYYTRVIEAADANLKKCLEYAKEFHENALDKKEEAGIETAIETSSEGDNQTLQHVTIHSNFEHITWGDLEPQVEENVRWQIKELNNSYVCLQMEYQVTCSGEENEQDEYKVEEFFKVRYSSRTKKMYLLEYDREMEQIFEPIRQVLGSKGVLLGIADEDVSYTTNKDETIVSFVQADELWSYDKEENNLTLIFSFDDEEGYDERNLTRKHEIEILNQGNDGDVRFAVKGYMNRGNHEGEVGIAVYYFDVEEQTVKEEAFVSYQRALGCDVYFNAGLKELYVLSEGTLYVFQMEYRSQNVIVENLTEEEYKISTSGNILAYVDKAEDANGQKIILMNMKKDEKQEIVCGENEILTPLGFIGTDFIYGVSRVEDAGTTISGQLINPFYKIEIQNMQGEVQLSYEKEGKYILDTDITDNMITISLAEKDDGVYVEERQDYITNNENAADSKIYLESYVTELKERQKRITFADGLENTEPKILKANLTLDENSISFALENEESSYYYDIYAYGEFYGRYHELGDAINIAKQHTGVVVDEGQNIVWQMSNRDLNYLIAQENQVIPALLENLGDGMTPMDAAINIANTTTVNLKGCKTEDLLYILNQDIPVIAMTGESEAVVLVGYNEISVFYKEPGSDTRHSVSYAEMDEMTEKSGNTYLGVK